MKRAKVFNTMLFTISLIFFAYLFFIQCIRSRHYQDISRKEHQRKVMLCGARGNIYDRNGVALATSEPCFSVFCTPQYAQKKTELARELAMISERPLAEIKKCLERGKFFWVETKASAAKKDQYLEINDPSIGFAHDLNRIYTMPEVFSNLIGICSSDNQGMEGLEHQFDDVLSGKSGFIVYQKDPTGDIFPYYNYPEKNPQPGQDLYLTIDLQLQTILQSNLKDCLSDENAKSAAGLIVNPRTGEILAMVNVTGGKNHRNITICDEFEPGSTFKMVSLVFALLNGIKESEPFNTEGGKIKIDGHTIYDYRNYGVVSLKQAIAHSSNVVMAQLSKRFKQDDFMMLVRDFGFTQPTGIEFPGEVKGKLMKEKDLNEIEFATLLFGQGITCNLLQITYAYQAIANDGVLNKPYIVSSIRQKNRTTYRGRPLRVRRIIDNDVARKATEILCSVVEEGSGMEAKIDGIKIAGKTGTSQKVIEGKYSKSQIITTFIGYFPADEPEYLVALMLDEPKKGLWASTITTPVFKRIAQSIRQITNSQYAAK